jgi:hypothetical protein
MIKRREVLRISVSGNKHRNYGKSEWNGMEFSVIDTEVIFKGKG